MTSPARPPVVPLLGAALLVYSGVALGVTGWWVSGLTAPGVAALLWWRHPRARFCAYVFFSAVILRGLATGSWASVLFAALAVALMQLPSARRAWPRLRPGLRPAPGDTMARP